MVACADPILTEALEIVAWDSYPRRAVMSAPRDSPEWPQPCTTSSPRSFRRATMLRSSASAMDMETAETLDAIRGEIRRVETTLSAEIDELRNALLESAAAGQRHTQVLFESLRDDIRLVAEGLAVVGAKVDRLTR